MNIDEKTFQQKQPAKCTACKNFYASEAYKGLCSSCYKKTTIQKEQKDNSASRKQSVNIEAHHSDIKQKASQKKQQQKPMQQAPQQVDRKRCFNCKKKVGLLGVECKCGYVYCNSHRLPEEHSCSFNHKKVANDRLKEALVKVYNGKITEI